jgi:prophage regulatory protein
MERQEHTDDKLPTILSPKQVRERLGLSSTTIFRMRRDGQLPQPIQLSPRRIGWTVTSIETWLADRAVATTK